jgi:hypothetical protein
MKTRYLSLIAVLLAPLGCTTDGYNGGLSITQTVLPEATTTTTGTTTVTTCKLSAGDPETLQPSFLTSAPVEFGYTGFVVENQLLDPSTLNPDLRTNTTNFNPDTAVVTYQIVGGAGIAEQRIPTTGASVKAGASNAVGVALFSPTAVLTALTAAGTGQVMTTTHIEGHLDDGTSVSTSKHSYLVNFCAAATATCGAIACFN